MLTEDYVKIAISCLEEKKAQEIKTLKVKGLSILYDYIIICSTSNTTHVKSLTLELEEILKKNNKNIKSIEADLNSTWVVLDCEDFIVNVFYEPTRKFYNLEGIWPIAPNLWFKLTLVLKKIIKTLKA